MNESKKNTVRKLLRLALDERTPENEANAALGRMRTIVDNDYIEKLTSETSNSAYEVEIVVHCVSINSLVSLVDAAHALASQARVNRFASRPLRSRNMPNDIHFMDVKFSFEGDDLQKKILIENARYWQEQVNRHNHSRLLSGLAGSNGLRELREIDELIRGAMNEKNWGQNPQPEQKAPSKPAAPKQGVFGKIWNAIWN